MDAPLLELTEITKSFGAVRALKGVSFDLRPGEVHALLGENGAGKSTLIKVITGAHQRDAGSMKVEGREIGSLDPRTAHRLGIACIYQQPALFPDLSVAENIAIALEEAHPFHRVRWRARTQQAVELLQRVGASIDPQREVRELSMPEQQLVEIAKALGAGARILLMDEPTASLTSAEVTLLLDVVRTLRAQGVGVIYISHRLEEIFAIADRVTVLRDGQSVGTSSVATMNEAELIRQMVGREVATIYPPREGSIGEVVLKVRDLGCLHSGVQGVSFDLRAGEVLGLSGLVGAGRTELARILFGITPADSGTIELCGEPLQIASPRDAVDRGIALVPEDRRKHGVILEMSIAANATMAVLRKIFRRGWIDSTAEETLTAQFVRGLGIKTASTSAAGGSLSGGNQQKVALARWLATKPKLLILDEPTQGVDVGAKAEIHKIIRSLAADGLAVLMISSDLPEVLGMSDRIAVMRGGRMVAEFPSGADPHAVMAAALGQTSKKEAA